MTTKARGGFVADSVDLSIDVQLYSSSTGQPLTGKAYGDITAYYYRMGAAAPVSIPAVTLASLDAAHTDGGFKEIDSTNFPGRYRFDVPDAAFADGADIVIVSVYCSGSQKFMVTWRIDSTSAGWATYTPTESYATNGSEPTVAQFFYMILQLLSEQSISGTTKTTKKLDRSTTAMTHTLDSATHPTSITRNS